MIKHIFITFLSLTLFQGFMFAKTDPNTVELPTGYRLVAIDEEINVPDGGRLVAINEKEVNVPEGCRLETWTVAVDNQEQAGQSGNHRSITTEGKPTIPHPPEGFTSELVTGKQDKKPVVKIPAGEVDLGPAPNPPEGFTEDVTPTLEPVETLPQENPIWQIATVFLILIAICLVQFLIYKYLLKILSMIRHLWKIKKLTILWMGILLIVLMGLFPPHIVGRNYREIHYMFLLITTDFKIDISRLFVQWVIVAVITGGLILTFQNKKD